MSDKEYLAKRKQLLAERQWLKDIIAKSGCMICGYNDDPLIIEQHHFAGKSNNIHTVSVCPTCHRKLSLKQKSWDKDWTNPDNSSKKKLAFELKGWADIHRLMAIEMDKVVEKLLKGKYEQ